MTHSFKVALSLLAVFGPLAAWSLQANCTEHECSEPATSDSSIMLQVRAMTSGTMGVEEKKDGRTAALDAQFLVQASFGPTRESLAELATTNYEDWIKQQIMSVPESHREYYRSHVNAHWVAGDIVAKNFAQSTPCSKGSRWHGYTFVVTDVGKWVKSAQSKIYTNNNFESDVDTLDTPPVCSDIPNAWYERKGWVCGHNKNHLRSLCNGDDWTKNNYCQQSCYDAGRGNRHEGDDCSGGWAKYAVKNIAGYLCSVEESVGGLLSLSKNKDCKERVYMQNPAILVGDPAQVSEVESGAFVTNSNVPDVVFHAAALPTCDLKQVVKLNGKYFRHEVRLGLQGNTLEDPQALAGFCVAKNPINKDHCKLQTSSDCPILCGSAGEVASDGQKGNFFSMITKDDKKNKDRNNYDKNLDSSYNGRINPKLTKTTIWTMKALQAKDQLRQRMANSLAQIIVVGVPGITNSGHMTENWVNFHDIFVRHAFGNFRDILQEVTYSPVMATYLTYMGSRSYDHSSSYPDENYAREIMQLFTVGVDQLHNNGSVVQDENNVSLGVYSNENIMNFARVFTGFGREAKRGNAEMSATNLAHNYIDPVRMSPRLHDKYPKPDLHGGFLGDRYPLCSDLPRRAFLAKDARYEFLGYSHSSDFVELTGDSVLATHLLAVALTVTLNEDVTCSGAECLLETVDVVKVGTAFYEYVAPTCVHHFFSNGKEIFWARNANRKKCVDPDTPAAGFSCCSGCTDTPNGWMKKKSYTCENAETEWTQRVWNKETKQRETKPKMFHSFCNKNKGWSKSGRQYCAFTCSQKSAEWNNELAYGGLDCSAGRYQEHLQCGSFDEQVSFSTAKSFCETQQMSLCGKPQAACGEKNSYLWSETPCATAIRVHDDGKVSAHTHAAKHAANKFAVSWSESGAPPAGNYDATVHEDKVFAALPASKEAIVKTLKIGAFKPNRACNTQTDHCSNEFNAFNTVLGIFDQNTIFEVDGNYFKNAESVVDVDEHRFRNPPVFIHPGASDSGGNPLDNNVAHRAAIAEVESLFDHLFHHPNTPVNIGKKLIQRFVTSNPTAAYTEAVADAFKTGSYNEVTFSGTYGDLGATIAAILLHPEARQQSEANDGLLREPMLKLMHFMRSMEYKDWRNEPVVLNQIDEAIGQFPYFSATVFNFYSADFMPASFSMSEPEPEGEPEPEPEPLVAPEFQIFTPPFAISLLNGINSLIENGVSDCGDGLGIGDGISGCSRGALEIGSSPTEGSVSADDAVSELDVLLTGGRLTPAVSQIVKDAYNSASDGHKVKAAQSAILLTPEFNTLGDPKPSGPRGAKPAPEPHTEKPYKAVVMVFLAGGADTYQMLVPKDCDLYNDYADVRKGMEIPNSALLGINAETQKACTKFGINPAMPNLHKLYTQANPEAAFVSNIGQLVEPTTSSELRDGATKKCHSQFSHSHAQASAQTMTCGSVQPRGVGGLLADELSKQSYTSSSFSVAGTATWSQGKDTSTNILDQKDGVKRFSSYDIWHEAIVNITDEKYGNVYCEGYAEAFKAAIDSSERIGSTLDSIDSPTLEKYPRNTALDQQLYQVARIIKTRGERVPKAERDFFFVQLGGWDHHSGIKDLIPAKLKIVDDAIGGFVDELKAQGIFENVVLVTESDFGRTLSFNGAGTDHGWGGNHIIVGGGINGGQVYNDFLKTYQLGSDYDAGRGRVIPEYPWESMMVPIAEWVGVTDPAVLRTIFPNLDNFNRSTHIISRDVLFKP